MADRGNSVPHMPSDDDEETSKDLMTCCMQLIHHSQWKSIRSFCSGSKVEIPRYFVIVERFGIRKELLDTDIMKYKTSLYAVHRSESVFGTFTGDIVRIYTDDVHTGYARLIKEKDNTELKLSDIPTIYYDNDKIHGPAVIRDMKWLGINDPYLQKNIKADRIFEFENNSEILFDMVASVHSPYWPVGATEWVKRGRSHGFPSKSLIKQVARYGCDFVQVSHNRLSNDGEWRFSFSKAELIIIKHWSISQRIAYMTLWGLNKIIASRNLCSYYFKTLMFWACEEKPTAFWDDDLLVDSVSELLIEMMKWVKSKFCANYFIPGNNMMDQSDTDLSYEIDALWRNVQARSLISEIIDTSRREELILPNTKNHIECPSWIKRALVIYQRVVNGDDNYTDLFKTDLATDLQNALYVELSDIYRGLRLQQKSVNCLNESDKHIYLLKSESHLLLAVNLCKSLERDVLVDNNQGFLALMTGMFKSRVMDASSEASKDNVDLHTKRRSTADRGNSLSNELKCLLYGRSREKHENKLVRNYSLKEFSERGNVNIALNTSTDADVKFYKDSPGRSPTVNISWFIAKAYLASLYYTTQRDVSLIIKTCDDIIDVYEWSVTNKLFVEKTFPVVLSTQWPSIYDKEIQQLLGFYSLCSYAFDGSSRSVYLGVCPVQLAIYLKIRIETLTEDHAFSPSKLGNYINDYDEHIRVCRCDEKVNNGLETVTIALSLFVYSMETKKNRHDSQYDRLDMTDFLRSLAEVQSEIATSMRKINELTQFMI